MNRTKRPAAPAIPSDTPMTGVNLYLHGMPEDCKVMKEHVEKLGGNIVLSYDQSSHIIVSHQTPLVAQRYARELPDKYRHTVIYFDWVLHVRHKRWLWSRNDYWVVPRPSPWPLVPTTAFRPFYDFDFAKYTCATAPEGITNKVGLNTLLREYPEPPPRKIEPLPPVPTRENGKGENGIFWQMTIWVQGPPGAREEMENEIRMNGGSTTTAIYQASRIIISRPYSSPSTDFKTRLTDAITKVKENRNSGRMGEWKAVAEDWLFKCLELERLLPTDAYLVPLDDPLNQVFWETVSSIDPYALVEDQGDSDDVENNRKHAVIYEELQTTAYDHTPNQRYHPARPLQSTTNDSQGGTQSTHELSPELDKPDPTDIPMNQAQNDIVLQLEEKNPLSIATQHYRSYVQNIISSKEPVWHHFYGQNGRLHTMSRECKIPHPVYDLKEIPPPSFAAMDTTSISAKSEVTQSYMPPTPAQSVVARSESPATTIPSIVPVVPEKQEIHDGESKLHTLTSPRDNQDESDSDWNDSDLEELASDWGFDEYDVSQSALKNVSGTDSEIAMTDVDIVEQGNTVDSLISVETQVDRAVPSRDLTTDHNPVQEAHYQGIEMSSFAGSGLSNESNLDASVKSSDSQTASKTTVANINIVPLSSSPTGSSTSTGASTSRTCQKRTLSEVTGLGEPLSSDDNDDEDVEMIDPGWPQWVPLPDNVRRSKPKRSKINKARVFPVETDGKTKREPGPGASKLELLHAVRLGDEEKFDEMVQVLRDQVKLHGRKFALFKCLKTNNLSAKFYKRYRLLIRDAVPGLPVRKDSGTV